MFQRNELRVEMRRRGLRRGRWRRRGEQSMAKYKEGMVEAGEVEKEKRRFTCLKFGGHGSSNW